MYSKLAFRNMKRSVSDYAVYFITLMLAVCLFYTFNSISAQQVMLELSNVQNESMGYLEQMITLASAMISVIFCILCLFANQFLIKRRKKEFGLYMSLGMGKIGVSRILVLETLLVAGLSLIVGIGLGVLVSQGMSVFTASLFNIPLKHYQFIFSMSAAIKTAVFFGLVFVLVMLFNIVAVSKYKLIDLLHASQKGQTQWIKSPVINALLAVAALALVGVGYVVLLNADITTGLFNVVKGGIMIACGTVLFYFSAITVFIYALSKNKKVRYKKINIFNLRQITSKINSAMVSLATISFLLLFTISILTNGISYKKTMENELALVAPFDASITIFNYDRAKEFDLPQIVKEIGIEIDKHENDTVNIYLPELNAHEIIYPYASGMIKKQLEDGSPLEPIAIKYSDYQKLMELQNIKPIQLSDNETLILTNMNEAQETIKSMTAGLTEYKIAGKTLTLAKEKYQLAALETETIGRMLACFVIPDKLAETLESNRTIINLQYKQFDQETNTKYEKRFDEMLRDNVLTDHKFFARGITKTTAIEESTGYTTNLLYVGIYLGIVFLIASGAVLGLRILSDASDEVERYRILRRIGATDRMVRQSILLQVFSYFGAPLLLAIPNAIVIGIFIKNQMTSTVASSTAAPVIFTALLLTILYGSYFLISYSGYKKIVNK